MMCASRSGAQFLNTMAELKSIATYSLSSPLLQAVYHVKGFYRANDGAGGNMLLIDTVGAAYVPGMVYPVGSNKAYVREIGQSRSFNIRWFGALGVGVSSYKQDSTAITNAIRYLNGVRGSKSLYFPSTSKFYGFNGDGIVLCDNIEIFGDGDGSKIIHVNAASGTVQFGTIFFTGTFGPSNALSIFKPGVPNYSFYPQTAGANWVKLVTAGDAANLSVGKIIVLGARKKMKGGGKSAYRWSEIVMEEISSIRSDTVYLNHALQENFVADTANPVIVDVNSGLTSRDVLGTDICTKNISIHDMYLGQSDFDLTTGLPFDLQKKPVNVIGYGETYSSKFYNLTLKSFGTFGGNMYNYCTITNLRITGSRKVFDFGYGSTNNTVDRINWDYYPSSVDDTTGERALTYFDDDFHHNIFTNIKVTGNQTHLNIFQCTKGAHDNVFDTWDYNLPDYIDTSASGANSLAAINLSDDTGYVQHNNIIRNFNILVDTISQWINYDGVSTNTRVINTRLENITFVGVIRNKTAHPAVDLNYSGNTIFKNISMPDGNSFRRVGADTASFINIYAPTMDFFSTDAAFTLVNNNNVFKSSKIGATIIFTPSANAPLNPYMGVTYFDSVGKHYYGYDGTIFKQLDNSNTHAYNQALAVGADTWNDGTPPSGTRTATYSWTNSDSMTTLFIKIKYATGGTANTTIYIALPSDVPLPQEGVVFNTTNDNMWADYARVSTTSSQTNASTSNVFFVKTGTGAYKLTVATSSINAKCVWVALRYLSQK